MPKRDNALILESGNNEAQFTKQGDGNLYIEIDNPWCGSTETGFGATTYIELSPVQAKELLTFLQDSFPD